MSDNDVKQITLPVGRLINESLFEKDIFKNQETGQEGTPSYKIEMAFDPDDVTGEGNEFEDAIIDCFVSKWGPQIEQDVIDTLENPNFKGNVKLPHLSGDRLAQKREARGKDGDAYKGKIVLRAKTNYNKFGQDAPGGIAVYDEEVKEVEPATRQVIYPGCFGQMAVTLSPYTTSEGDPAVTLYLSAFQKHRDGDRLVSQQDRSSLFKPVGKAEGGRRSRKG